MKIPVKSLANLNWLMAIVAGGFLSIFMFTYLGFSREASFVVIQSTVNVLVISFTHVFILLKVKKYGRHLSENKQRFCRYSITFLFTLAYSFCVSPLKQVFADQTWRVVTPGQQLITIIAGSAGLNAFIIIMHNFIIAYRAKNSAEMENAQLRAANAEANTLLLKQQIHPHFLFNALTIIKSLYKKEPAAGDEYIVHLANFLRAAISDTTSKLVTLDGELKLCSDYIAMQKIRFGGALRCDINVPASGSNADFLPSFSLQPLIENAIKHNDVTDEQPLVIRLFKEGGDIVVENNLQRKKIHMVSAGNGLANLVKRYRLLSVAEPVISDNDRVFSVRLKILKA